MTGKIEQFDFPNGNWRVYIDRLEQYFVVNGIKEELKVPTLIVLIGPAAYELLVDLCVPQSPVQKPYSELVKLLGEHLQPRQSMIVKRYRFRQRVQELSESVSDYAATLKKLARPCEFGNNLDEGLRDQFVCGIKCGYTRQTLFTHTDLSFQKALEIALNIENTGK